MTSQSSPVVFSVTAAQLATLRAIAKKSDANPFADARRDPRCALVNKGLLACGDGYSTFTMTDFGRALLAALGNK